jgi:hypothetical protein
MAMSDPVTIAIDMVKACVRGDWTAAYANADPKFARGVTEFMNAETWRQVRLVAGNLVSVDSTVIYRHLLAKPAIRTVFVHCKFDRMPVIVHVSFSDENKILGLAVLTTNS